MKSKIALVTGGTRGIGLAIAEALAQEDGMKVIVCGLRDHLSVNVPLGVDYIKCDISSYQEVKSMINKIISKYKKIDILINNAGVSTVINNGRILIEEINEEEWHRVINTNLAGAFYTCKEVIPYMKKNGYGRIINISSASARFGGVLASVDYISSKAGLIGLTKGLAYELRDVGININAIAPGRIDTDMTSSIKLKPEWIKDNIPLGRIGTGEDIAGVVLFLISKNGNYMHGATIDCNGGWVIS